MTRKINTRKDFDEYVARTFSESTETANFYARFGEPTEMHAAIGMIAIKFAELEEKLAETIRFMLQLDRDRSDIVTAELSFNSKLDLFSSLYLNLKTNFYFNAFPDFEDEYIRAFLNALRRGADMRNRVVHSQFLQTSVDEILVKKTTAKQRGLKRREEKVSTVDLLNIVDYLYLLIFELNEFQIDMMKSKDILEKRLSEARRDSEVNEAN